MTTDLGRILPTLTEHVKCSCRLNSMRYRMKDYGSEESKKGLPTWDFQLHLGKISTGSRNGSS